MDDVVEVESVVPKKRGILLTGLLILMFIANPLTTFTYLQNPEAITEVYPALSINLLYFMGLLGVINFALAIAIWCWKKLGVYGFYVSMALAFCINIYAGLGLVSSLMGLIGGVLIFFTTKSRWKHFS